MKYFSDGCAAQFKKIKNLINICHYSKDFNLSAEWLFFATSHGKSPCDGIGGLLKELCQESFSGQILDVNLMYSFCKAKITVICFKLFSKEEINQT